MATRSSKDRLFDGPAAVGKPLSSGRRLELLDVLSQGDRSVERPAGEIDQSVATTSAHLHRLFPAGLRLPKGGDIVAYYRGPFCAYADDAVRPLRQRGVRAWRLEDGFPEWRRAGLPVAVGADVAASAP